MTPPISIDGTDITAATIDGTDVTEITVDGDVVFSAGPSNLPVAYSNLVAWYPFDSAEYGGSNADDVTAIIGGSGDDTAYDGTVNGATYQSSGGVTDINAGQNSGAFDFDGSNDDISTSLNLSNVTEFSLSLWFKTDTTSGLMGMAGQITFSNSEEYGISINNGDVFYQIDDLTSTKSFSVPINANEYYHAAISKRSNDFEYYLNGQSVFSKNEVFTFDPDFNFDMGHSSEDSDFEYDGSLDDVRVYNKGLSTAEIQQIVQNTQDPNNPVFP